MTFSVLSCNDVLMPKLYCYRCGGRNPHTWRTIVFTKNKSATIVKNKDISSEFVKQTAKTPEVHAVEVDIDAYDDVLATLEVHDVSKQNNDIIWVDLNVYGKPLKMELDTGSAVTVVSFDLYQQKCNINALHKTGLLLKTYTGEIITPVEILKNWPPSSLSPIRDGRSFKEIPHYQHPYGTVSVQPTSVWHHLCTCCLAA